MNSKYVGISQLTQEMKTSESGIEIYVAILATLEVEVSSNTDAKNCDEGDSKAH